MPNQKSQVKLREAWFFLGLMRDRDKCMNLGKREEFGFCLSALLAAAVSVQEVLNRENQAALAPVREAWLEGLQPDVRVVIDTMWHNRRKTIHQGRNPATQGIEQLPWIQGARDRSGRRTPVIIQPGMFDSGATVGVAVYTLKIDGKQVPAVEVCQRYLEALEALVANFGDPAA